ncbi:MAG: S9 family peptidase [Deltaproteobacteria bacterium]|nr:S9 family peptidase [Deltaproteobacteria bacterium]
MLKRIDLEENAVWKQRFRAPGILWAKIANLNPKRGLVCTDRDGTLQLYAWRIATGELHQLTHQQSGVVVGLISADGEYVYYMKDDGGNEIGHFVRVPFTGGPQEDVTPDLPPYGSFQINQSFCGNVISSRITDPSGQMLYVFSPSQAPHLIHKSQSLFNGPSLSNDGKIAVIATTEGTNSSDTRLMAFDLKNGDLMAELWDGEGVSHDLSEFSPLPDDFRMLSTTSKSGYARPIIWNPLTTERKDLSIDQIPGEVSAWLWSKNAKHVLLSQFYRAQHQLFLYNLDTETVTKLQHPDGVLGSYFDTGVFTDDDKILITWQDLSHPSRLIALDGNTGKELSTVLEASDVPPGSTWQSITFTAENGATIQSWLATPEGEGPFPTIIHTHGGPTTVMADNYSPEIQSWIDHGMAFFSINYHGSTTFGKEFEKSILGQPGELEVQDISAGYKWLIENKVAQADAVFLTGESYGGYLTLQAIAKLPEMWAGGIAGVAIADWAMMYEDESESLRGYHRVLFGGTPGEKIERHIKSSPITHAEQIQAPIIVIQGSNDTRCPPRQMQAYETKLKSLGKQIEVHWFKAGHGSRAQEQRLKHQEYRLRFVYQVLNKKYEGSVFGHRRSSKEFKE